LVGRKAELAVLEGALARATEGASATILVHGASGIGKTALVRHFLDGAARTGVAIFEGRCFEREQVPYKALDSLVDSMACYLSRLSAVEAADLMPRDVANLARLFPVLEQVGAVQRAPRRSSELADVQELRR